MFRNIFSIKNAINQLETVNFTFKRYAGHSKWANIKHIKGEKDAQRSLLFTRLSRQIKVAIQEGGSTNPVTNAKLSQIVDQAKRLNMPVASIQNVIKSTQMDKDQCKTYLLEVRGPGGSMLLFEVFTNNLVQTKQQIATILKKHKSTFSDGGGKHLFDHKGIIDTELPAGIQQKDDILEAATNHAIEAGAEDVVLNEDDTLQFVCEPNAIYKVQNALEKLSYKITSASSEYIPQTERMVSLNQDDMSNCGKLCEKLQNMNEVIRMYDNVS